MAKGVCAVVLAAGRLTRAGTVNKLLLPFRGTTLLGAVLDALRASSVSEVVVVTGYQAGRVAPLARRALHGAAKPWRIRHAAQYTRGLSASLTAGIAAVSPGMRGALICLADMPLLSPAIIDALIGNWRHGDIAALPLRSGKWGNPVLLSRRLFPKVRRLTGDRGARPMLKRSKGRIALVPMTDRAVDVDIDRLDDWAALAAPSSPGPQPSLG